MFAYDIDLLLMIKSPKSEYPDITQPCYDGDSGALGTFFAIIELYFNWLKRFGPSLGY